MQCKKILSIFLLSITMLSSLNADWSDRWVSIKNYFSGFVKKPNLTRKQLVVGGVGVLAIAGGAVWWYNRPASDEKMDPLPLPLEANNSDDDSFADEKKPLEFAMIDNDSKVDDIVTLIDGGSNDNYAKYVGNSLRIKEINKASKMIYATIFYEVNIVDSWDHFRKGSLLGDYDELVTKYDSDRSLENRKNLKQHIQALLKTIKCNAFNDEWFKNLTTLLVKLESE